MVLAQWNKSNKDQQHNKNKNRNSKCYVSINDQFSQNEFVLLFTFYKNSLLTYIFNKRIAHINKCCLTVCSASSSIFCKICSINMTISDHAIDQTSSSSPSIIFACMHNNAKVTVKDCASVQRYMI